jgi:uncharacterized protein YhbP (UPF0306 family)
MAPPRDSKNLPNEQELKDRAVHLAAEQTTMTLATAGGEVAWAAPVYYVFFKSAFYFLSDPESRHVREALQSGQASAAVYPPASSTWREIRGLQMTGCIRPVEGGREALQALRAYLKKYPFTREFFETGASLDLAGFSERFGVRLYKFRPVRVYYLDNRIRFAFRAEVAL